MALEGAVEDPDLKEWDDEDIDEEVLDYYLRRLDEYLNNKVFVSLLNRDHATAAYWYWSAVVDQPYILDEDGEICITLPDEDE